MLAAAQFGAVLSPVGAAWLIEAVGWRWTFAVFGSLGVAWAVGFRRWFRDDPAEHAGVNAAELACHPGRPAAVHARTRRRAVGWPSSPTAASSCSAQ
jgi:MFS family permease